MNIRKIKLIWAPDFLKEYENNDFYSFNNFFWEYIFNPNKSWKLINTKQLSKDEKTNIKYILSNLNIAYKFFKIMKNKEIWIENMIFCFNIISNYLKIIEKFTKWIKIKFYDYFEVDDIIYENIEENLFYNFFTQENNEWFNELDSWDIVKIDIQHTYQLSQLYIINYIIENKKKINVKYEIFLWDLVLFENQKMVEKKLLENFNNLEVFRTNNNVKLSNISFSDNFYYKYTIFDWSCSWNKCSFCNIWKKQKLSYDINEKIDLFLNFVDEKKLKYVQIWDPSISINQLTNLSKKIINKKLKIKFKIFTRFSNEFTDSALSLFSKAGLRFLWIWLESTSPRLNNLMKKYDRDYSEEDFSDLVCRCKKFWINVHYYTIFWFPTETKEEIIWTKNFLLKHLKQNDFFSYTAWFFWLNKWTDVYLNKKRYWVSFQEANMWWEIFIKNYDEKNITENWSLLLDTRNELLSKLFFWDVYNNVNVINFWHFIEHSSIFHIQKLKLNINPYLDFFSKNKSINYENMCINKFKVNGYLQFTRINNFYKVKNCLLETDLILSSNSRKLLKNYNKSITLKENILILSLVENKNLNDEILELIKKFFLIKL